MINITRLKRAPKLLSEGDHKIYEVEDMVGFKSQSNFAGDFLKQFNVTPTEYMHSKQFYRKVI